MTLFCSCQSLTIYFSLITFQVSYFEAGVYRLAGGLLEVGRVLAA